MNKVELISRANRIVWDQGGHVRGFQFYRALTETIMNALENGEKVKIPGFGTFEVREYASRTCHNPNTGEDIVIPARMVPVFRPYKALKESVNA